MTAAPLLLEQGADGLVTVTLNRPDAHNALDELLVRELTRSFDMLSVDPACRLVVLKANGPGFCAGSDLGWMQRTAGASQHAHLLEAQNLALMMKTLHMFPKPLLAMVQGTVAGVGVGLLACCDVVVASDSASFRLSDVKFGLVPAVVGPYVVQAIGVRAAKRYFITAEPFSATEAKGVGLVHEIVPDRMMAAAASKLVERIVAGGPKAQIAAKDLVRRIDSVQIGDDMSDYTVNLIARLRASPEAREGLAAYLEKRNPAWPRR